jgi:hypothetical protein
MTGGGIGMAKELRLEDIPGRIFLDTCTVNFILDNGECIFENEPPSGGIRKRELDDIEALRLLFLSGQRAQWQLAVSPSTYEEISATPDDKRRYYLDNWFNDIWQHWLNVIEESSDVPDFEDAQHISNKLLKSGRFNVLPGEKDRVLLCDSIAFNCDCFCTRDYRTILKYRNRIPNLSIKILSPKELIDIIKPFLALWL